MTSSRPDLVPVRLGTRRKVLMLQKVAKVFADVPDAPRARVLESMKKYAEGHSLPETLFVYESREARGNGKEIAVFAFKAKGLRVYGVEMTLDGQASFICSEIDTAKKQTRADPRKLQSAAKNVGHLF